MELQSAFQEDFRHTARATVDQGNVQRPEDCRRIIQEVLDQNGRLDIFINNAGITIDKMAMPMSVEDWDAVRESGCRRHRPHSEHGDTRLRGHRDGPGDPQNGVEQYEVPDPCRAAVPA